MLKNKVLLTFAVLILAGIAATAQTNSPYTRFGYGALGDNSFGMGRAMGGIGYGLRTNQQINAMNPASYAAMDSLTFLFDIGANIQNTWFKEGSLRESNLNGNLEYLAMQFPLGKYMAASIGLLPFSTVGYEFSSTISGGSDLYSGDGGFSQAYIGLGANLYKGLSIGFNASYMFGSITHSAKGIPTEGNYSTFDQMIRVNDFRIQAGIQYTQKLNEKNKMTFGFVYTPKKALLGKKYDLNYITTSSNSQAVSGDTTSIKGSYSLPETYGGGVSYVWDNRLTVGADVTYQNWSDVEFDGNKSVFNNRLKIALGGEFLPSRTDRNYLNRIKYRAGVYYNKSYLKVNGSDLREIGATCGFGFPIKNDKSMINVAFEYVNQTPANKTLITENYLRMSVSLTFNEMWFYQFKFK